MGLTVNPDNFKAAELKKLIQKKLKAATPKAAKKIEFKEQMYFIDTETEENLCKARIQLEDALKRLRASDSSQEAQEILTEAQQANEMMAKITVILAMNKAKEASLVCKKEMVYKEEDPTRYENYYAIFVEQSLVRMHRFEVGQMPAEDCEAAEEWQQLLPEASDPLRQLLT